MTITIRNKEVVALMQELKALTGKEEAALLLRLLKPEVKKLRPSKLSLKAEQEARYKKLMVIAKRAWKKIPKGKKFEHPDDIIGYGHDGLPE